MGQAESASDARQTGAVAKVNGNIRPRDISNSEAVLSTLQPRCLPNPPKPRLQAVFAVKMRR